jgi:hypothetical protein
MNHSGTALIGRVAQWALAALGIIFVVMIFSGNEAGIDGGLWVTYIAFGLSTLIAVVFSLTNLTKKSLLGIGLFVVLLAVAYGVSDSSVRPEWNISESASKWIGAGLILLYLSLFGAIAAILYGEITRLLK